MLGWISGRRPWRQGTEGFSLFTLGLFVVLLTFVGCQTREAVNTSTTLLSYDPQAPIIRSQQASGSGVEVRVQSSRSPLLLSVTVENRGKVPFGFGPEEVRFLHVDEWHSGNTLFGRRVSIYAGTCPEENTDCHRATVEPGDRLSIVVGFVRHRTGSYFADLNSGSQRAIAGPFTPHELGELRSNPSRVFVLESGLEEGDARGARRPAAQLADRLPPGHLVLRAGENVHAVEYKL